ncbi:MAG: preprotein translocase subunit SecG [Candidatus Cloacimonetes bacterium]|nr:preprotein translocase subunit SecG [Candidatus Cloacimonadota bacterium]
MFTVLLAIHVIVCISLIISVLLQSSKGGGLGGAFGGGSSDTLFGGQGASSFLKKTTKVLGISFMIVTVLLALTTTPRKKVEGKGEVSKELQQVIDESSQTEEPTPLPEGFEILPEPTEE